MQPKHTAIIVGIVTTFAASLAGQCIHQVFSVDSAKSGQLAGIVGKPVAIVDYDLNPAKYNNNNNAWSQIIHFKAQLTTLPQKLEGSFDNKGVFVPTNLSDGLTIKESPLTRADVGQLIQDIARPSPATAASVTVISMQDATNITAHFQPGFWQDYPINIEAGIGTLIGAMISIRIAKKILTRGC